MEQSYNDILFMQLVKQNQQLALVSMGKIENPVLKKTEVNLDHAKIAIDTLEMLVVKTKGNLSDYEEKYLSEVVRELKLNYVDSENKKSGAK